MTDDPTILVPPNLDAMTKQDLGAFVKNALLLSHYAKAKINAMTEREAGNIEKALAHERQCEAIYGLMPEAMRW